MCYMHKMSRYGSHKLILKKRKNHKYVIVQANNNKSSTNNPLNIHCE